MTPLLKRKHDVYAMLISPSSEVRTRPITQALCSRGRLTWTWQHAQLVSRGSSHASQATGRWRELCQVHVRVTAVQGNGTASLAEVCYKPFGEECATQSLLQYWQMNRTIYEQGFPPHHTKLSPEFCFGHWSTQVRILFCCMFTEHPLQRRLLATEMPHLLITCAVAVQCRAAFGGPIDPHLVLGGFPTDASFNSYSADATSFIVTYPLDSSADKRYGAYTSAGALARP